MSSGVDRENNRGADLGAVDVAQVLRGAFRDAMGGDFGAPKSRADAHVFTAGKTRAQCPSILELSALADSGVEAEAGSHVSACPHCAATLQELVAARVELLGPNPAQAKEAAAQAAHRISALAREISAKERQARARRWLFWLPTAVLPVAAGLAIFATAPRSQDAGSNELSGVVATESTVRTKSSGKADAAFALLAYDKRGDEIFPLKDGAEVSPGDRLQFAYSHNEPGFLLVFSVDDAGSVSPYYDDAKLSPLQVQSGSHVMLPWSIELDTHKGVERVFGLWSANALDESRVRAAVTRALADVQGDVRRIAALPLAGAGITEDVQQVTLLLLRP